MAGRCASVAALVDWERSAQQIDDGYSLKRSSTPEVLRCREAQHQVEGRPCLACFS
jgi:hypothetical protein